MVAEVGAGRGCQTISRVSLMTLGLKCGSLPRFQFCQIQCQSEECSASVALQQTSATHVLMPVQMKGSYNLVSQTVANHILFEAIKLGDVI
jgi:hypothetical protein